MDDFNSLLRQSLDLKAKREERYKEISKTRLYEISRKKIQTTMIGALDTIEKSFGFLWEADGELTPEQSQLKKIFEEARSQILDRGNAQMRNLKAEFVNYDINWKKYSLTLPVVNKKEGEKDDRISAAQELLGRPKRQHQTASPDDLPALV